MNGIFELNNQPYNLRKKTELKRRCVKTVHYGTETISFLSPKIWNIIPKELKEITSVLKFRKEIKKWKPTVCPCRLCKTYVKQVGFIWVPLLQSQFTVNIYYLIIFRLYLWASSKFFAKTFCVISVYKFTIAIA